MLDLFRLLLPTLAALFHERHDLILENLLLRHQLQVALRSRPRPNFKTKDRFFWLVVRWFFPAWRRHLVLVRPETVIRWHRRGWRLYWCWRSGRHLGRVPLTPLHAYPVSSAGRGHDSQVRIDPDVVEDLLDKPSLNSCCGAAEADLKVNTSLPKIVDVLKWQAALGHIAGVYS